MHKSTLGNFCLSFLYAKFTKLLSLEAKFVAKYEDSYVSQRRNIVQLLSCKSAKHKFNWNVFKMPWFPSAKVNKQNDITIT